MTNEDVKEFDNLQDSNDIRNAMRKLNDRITELEDEKQTNIVISMILG